MKRTLVGALLIVVAATGCGGGGTKKTSTATPTAGATNAPIADASVAAAVAGLGPKCASAAAALAAAGTAGATGDLGNSAARAATAMKAIENSVPAGEVRDAVATLAGVYAKVAEATKGVTYTPGKPPPPGYIGALKLFADPKFAAAGKTVGAYFSGGCK
jgi:hypothetical protein